MEMLRTLVHRAGRAYVERICRNEHADQSYAVNERTAALQFTFRHLRLLRPVRIVDIGVSASAFPQVLRECGYVVDALATRPGFNRHYLTGAVEGLRGFSGVDLVTCILSLQTASDPSGTVQQIFRALCPGGHLLLAVPYNEREPLDDVYALPEARWRRRNGPGRIFARRDLSAWASANHAALVEEELWECFTGPYWECGERIRPPRRAEAGTPHHLVCAVYRKELDSEPAP